jgi:hypothetical protein
MKTEDFKGVISALSEASPSHLALASFAVLPFVLDFWLKTLLNIIPSLTSNEKIIAVCIVLLTYFMCLVWLAKENQKKKSLEKRRDIILARMITNDWIKIGFESAKKSLPKGTTDEDIVEVIEAFPRSLRYVKMRQRDENNQLVKDAEGKQLYKHGVGRVSFADSEDA